MTFGFGMLSLLSVASNVWQTSLDALWVGLGMGMVMQVLVLAVQNSVDYKHLGVATSGTMLFRALGGALGVALFGAIFANGLHAQLAGPGMEFLAALVPSAVQGLPPNLQQQYISAVMAALQPVFLAAAAISALGFVLAWLLREIPLREGTAARGAGRELRDAARRHLAAGARAHRHAAGGASRIAGAVYADLARARGLDLPAPELWMLARLGEREPMTMTSLSAELEIPQQALERPLRRAARARDHRAERDRPSRIDSLRRRHARPRRRRATEGARRHACALAAGAASRRGRFDRAHGAGADQRPAEAARRRKACAMAPDRGLHPKRAHSCAPCAPPTTHVVMIALMVRTVHTEFAARSVTHSRNSGGYSAAWT